MNWNIFSSVGTLISALVMAYSFYESRKSTDVKTILDIHNNISEAKNKALSESGSPQYEAFLNLIETLAACSNSRKFSGIAKKLIVAYLNDAIPKIMREKTDDSDWKNGKHRYIDANYPDSYHEIRLFYVNYILRS